MSIHMTKWPQYHACETELVLCDSSTVAMCQKKTETARKVAGHFFAHIPRQCPISHRCTRRRCVRARA